MKRIALALLLAAMFAASTRWTLAQQPPLFTGTSTTMDGKDLTAARRNFEAGARTYWHSHSNGQLLMVEKGRMRLQKRGEAVKELAIGGSDYTGPNVVHWHGATPAAPMVQINVGFGGATNWLEAVTDQEYSGK
jgi:quercetin dioxygenase-like cupin family protein